MLDKQLYKIIEQALDKSFFLKYTSEFSTRIIVQKVLYLLTHGHFNPKISLPYSWNFYLRGPYSSEIAHMIYHIHDFKDDVIDKPFELYHDVKNSINHFRKFKAELDSLIQNSYDSLRINNADIYELLATLTYISIQIGRNKSKLIEKLEIFKPDLKEKLPHPFLDDIIEILVKYKYI